MFRAPRRDDAGVVQFRQYIRWVECTLDVALLDPTDDDDQPLPIHHRMASARKVCDRLRDGVVLNALMGTVEVAAGGAVKHHNGGTVRNGSAGTTVLAAQRARSIAQARHRFVDVMTSEALRAGMPHCGIVLDDLMDSEAAVPSVQSLYGGNFDAMSMVLFHCFHVSVMRERYRLAPAMFRWYRSVAAVYDIPFEIDATACDPDALDRAFYDGLLWIVAMHNAMAEVALDLSTVCRYPVSRRHITSNLSFAYCLFELHGIFTYFPTLDDFIDRRNHHFLFMQCFLVYQRFEHVAVREVAVEELVFAPQSRLEEQLGGDLGHGGSGGTIYAAPDGPPQHAAGESPHATVADRRDSTTSSAVCGRHEDARTVHRHRGDAATPHRRPANSTARTPSSTKPPAAHPRVKQGCSSFGRRTHVAGKDEWHAMAPAVGPAPEAAPLPDGRVPLPIPLRPAVATAHSSRSFQCKVAAGESGVLSLVPSDVSFDVGSRGELVLQLQGMGTFRLPMPSLDTESCRKGKGGTVVVVEYNRNTPSAPPPYHNSHAPAITLFFSSPEDASACYLELSRPRAAQYL